VPRHELITKADKAKREARERAERIKYQDKLRRDFYLRQGLSPPTKPETKPYVTPSTNGEPQRLVREQRDVICSNPTCGISFSLDRRQRKRYDEGGRIFYHSAQSRNEAISKKGKRLTWKEKRARGTKKIPLDSLLTRVMPLLAENGGNYTWVSLAADLGYWKTNRG
jgi:hypothetical protein